ncbi:MAG: cohesin domain-containing protein [Bacteroidota bacterium]
MSFGQTASLENKTAIPNTATDVALHVGNFTSINSLTFYIRYDPTVLSFTGFSSPALPGMSVVAQDSTIYVFWSSPTPQTISGGDLCKLNFMYYGASTPLGFLPTCSVVHNINQNLLIGYTNGSVSPDCSTSEYYASIGSSWNFPGDFVALPLTYGINSIPVNAITQNIKYDPNELSFVGVAGYGVFGTGTNAYANNGLVNIAWTYPNPAGVVIDPTNDEFSLMFVYNNPNNTALSFAPGCEISKAPGYVSANVCYSGGVVKQYPTADTVTIGSLSNVIQGSDITVPFLFDVQSTNVSGFTFYLHFDSDVMSFTGMTPVDPLSSNVMANAVGSLLTIVYYDPALNYLPGSGTTPFFNLQFHYNGMGAAHINFLPGSQIQDWTYQTMNITFNNSVITPGIWPPYASVTLGSVSATAGSDISVPLSIDGYTSNPLGAATMYIGYDSEKLEFTGLSNNPYGAYAYANNNQIAIDWSDPSGDVLTGHFLDLNFHYNGGGGSPCSSSLFFKNDDLTKQPCELASSMAVYVPANWLDGGVNIAPAVPTITGVANPHTLTTKGYKTDPGMINYVWNVIGDATITYGQGTDSIAIQWGAAGDDTITVSYNTSGGCYVSNTKPVTVLPASTFPVAVSGQVTYDNVNASYPGMNNVHITFTGTSGAAPLTAVTASDGFGNHGFYSFAPMLQDNYTVTATVSAPWGGISALDALIVELYTAGYVTLSPLRYKAANANGILPVNATDALLIKQRVVDSTNFKFPVSVGNWVFPDTVAHVFGSGPIYFDFKALCTGDVNGSYIPNPIYTKSTPVIATSENEIMMIPVNKSFAYDLKSLSSTEIGAMTLFLKYDQELFEIEKINTKLDGMAYSIKNGLVSIAWSNTNSMQLQSDATILSFQVKARKSLNEATSIFAVQHGSEFGDPGANVLGYQNLKLAKVITTSINTEFSMINYPNPFANTTTIVYQLPDAGTVRLIMTDLYGKQIATLVNGQEDSGMHSFTFNPSTYNLSSGVYLYKIELETSSDIYTRINKMVYTH